MPEMGNTQVQGGLCPASALVVLQQAEADDSQLPLSPCRGLWVSGHARSVVMFGLNLYSSSCWHWLARSIYCGYRRAALVCVQETKTGGGPEILCFALKVPPWLHFLSNRALGEMRWAYVYVSQLFSEMVFTGMFIPASLMNFYFATQCVQSNFPSSPFLFSPFFFLISFEVQTQVFVITETIQKFSLSTWLPKSL